MGGENISEGNKKILGINKDYFPTWTTIRVWRSMWGKYIQVY